MKCLECGKKFPIYMREVNWCLDCRIKKSHKDKKIQMNKFNLEAHQCLEEVNINTIINLISEASFENQDQKNLSIEFLVQLKEQAPLLKEILKEREEKITFRSGS